MSKLGYKNLQLGKNYIELSLTLYGNKIKSIMYFTNRTKESVLNSMFSKRDYFYMFSSRSITSFKHINILKVDDKFYMVLSINTNGVKVYNKRIIKDSKTFYTTLNEFIEKTIEALELDTTLSDITISSYSDTDKGMTYMIDNGFIEPFIMYDVVTDDGKYIVVYNDITIDIKQYLNSKSIHNINTVKEIGYVTNKDVTEPSILKYDTI